MLLLNHLSTKCQQNESFKKKGCHETFSWPMQVVMQRAKCQYPKPVIHKKYSLIDGKYRCAKYSKIFLHQASATRHGNIDWAKGKKGHKCIVYSKVFPNKSQLEKHKTIHAKLASKNAWNVKDMSEGKTF